MKLWIESAHQSLAQPGGDVVKVFTTEDQFLAILASGLPGGAEGQAWAAQVADGVARLLAQPACSPAVLPAAAAEKVLAILPAGAHVPFSILQVEGGNRAWLVECDAPPLFLARDNGLVLLPVLEEETAQGHLVRECQFLLQAGDHLAMVSEGYIHARGWSRRWGWRDIANSIKRWTDTGCDAGQLLGALVRMYRRLAGEPVSGAAEGLAPSTVEGESGQDVTVLAMYVRPIRTVTVWSGPPSDPAQDAATLEKLMAEPGVRVICGDTTAQIAARLLGAELEMEPRPEGGGGEIPRSARNDRVGGGIADEGDEYIPCIGRHPWAEVPPVSRLAGVSLVTEGLVTLEKARERLARAKQVSDLPRGDDGATRLARVLLAADKVHLIVGLAVNPAQAADAARTVPLRQVVVERLARDLQARDKLVSIETV